ncbi:MAG: FAD-dependent oxidoreductase [Alphaproteobacteria bacterium]
MHVVICGGGVVGACTAYFLARRGIDVTVVERVEVASSASGKAGGFLARDWCAGSPLDALAQRSFALHASLQDEIGSWSYQRVSAYSGVVVADDDERRHIAPRLAWLSGGVIIGGQLSTTETTAMVNPRAFTVGMMRAAEQHGARLRIGEVTGFVRRGVAIGGVEVGGETLDADAVVVTMGPWSLRAAQWLQIPMVFGMRSPSLVYSTGRDVPAEALFLDYEDNGDALTIEVFPRADGSTHVTAFSGQLPLPIDPADVKPRPEEVTRLQAICERLSPALRPERIIARQACFRPVTQDGLPLIGRLSRSDGAYVATGHSVWGILNAPATGEALAEVIADGRAETTDLISFDPARLRPLDPASIRIA